MSDETNPGAQPAPDGGLRDQAAQARQRDPITGRWPRGTSGNPTGRPKGVGKLANLRAKMAEGVEGVVGVVYREAMRGDIAAASLYLSRVVPAVRPGDVPTEYRVKGDTMGDRARAILDAVAAGKLAPAQGVELLTAMASAAKVIETEELAERIERLEQAQRGQP